MSIKSFVRILSAICMICALAVSLYTNFYPQEKQEFLKKAVMVCSYR